MTPDELRNFIAAFNAESAPDGLKLSPALATFAEQFEKMGFPQFGGRRSGKTNAIMTSLAKSAIQRWPECLRVGMVSAKTADWPEVFQDCTGFPITKEGDHFLGVGPHGMRFRISFGN